MKKLANQLNSLLKKNRFSYGALFALITLMAYLGVRLILPSFAGVSYIDDYIKLPGDQIVTVPNGVYGVSAKGGIIRAEHPQTNGKHGGWLILKAESKHGVVVDLEHSDIGHLILAEPSSRIAFIGFKFINGKVEVTGKGAEESVDSGWTDAERPNDIVFWHTDHQFSPNSKYAQEKLVGAYNQAQNRVYKAFQNQCLDSSGKYIDGCVGKESSSGFGGITPDFAPTIALVARADRVGFYGSDFHDGGTTVLSYSYVDGFDFIGSQIFNAYMSSEIKSTFIQNMKEGAARFLRDHSNLNESEIQQKVNTFGFDSMSCACYHPNMLSSVRGFTKKTRFEDGFIQARGSRGFQMIGDRGNFVDQIMKNLWITDGVDGAQVNNSRTISGPRPSELESIYGRTGEHALISGEYTNIRAWDMTRHRLDISPNGSVAMTSSSDVSKMNNHPRLQLTINNPIFTPPQGLNNNSTVEEVIAHNGNPAKKWREANPYDSWAQYLGINTSNNVSSNADLIVENITMSPSNPMIGDKVRFSATIKNVGSSATEDSVVHGITFEPGDGSILWSDNISTKLDPGQNRTQSANGGNSPNSDGLWTAVAGTHNLKVTVDNIDRIAESNNNNNVKTISFNVSEQGANQPDLRITEVSYTPLNPEPGDQVVFTATIKNEGTLATPAGTIHGVLFQVDGVSTSWSDNSTASLAPGESRILTANSGPAPDRTNYWTAGSDGTYTLRAAVDDVNRIPESNENNNSIQQSVQVITKDSEIPSKPGNFRATVDSANQVTLNWDASSDNVAVDGYRIKRDGVTIALTKSLSFVDSNLSAATDYQYRVQAYDTSNNHSAPSDLSIKTANSPDTEPPTAPTNLRLVTRSTDQIVIQWDASSDNVGVTHYRVFRDGQYISNATGTNYGDGTVEPGKTYEYTVKAVDGNKNPSEASNKLQVTASNPANTASRSPSVACDATLDTKSNIQAEIDRLGEDKTICFKAGLYRLTSTLVPKKGQKFYGQMNGKDSQTVMNGAKVLTPASAKQSSGRWYWEGQTQQGEGPGMSNRCFDHTGTDPLTPNYPRGCYPEELFVNGYTKLHHEENLANLGSGEWHLDYNADRIYIKDNPSSFSSIEATATPQAFKGRHQINPYVHIENIIFEKFASPTTIGAAGDINSFSWTFKHVEARYNHGAGLAGGNGTIFENIYSHHNGQIGVKAMARPGGNPPDPWKGKGPLVMRNSEIAFNNTNGYSGWESGGFKFGQSKNSTVVNNWVHDNYGNGIWLDVENENTQIYSNLSEHNASKGIFYEVSQGNGTKIYWNIVKDNGLFDGPYYDWRQEIVEGNGAGILISNSEGAEVFQNLATGNLEGIVGLDTARNNDSHFGPTDFGVSNLYVHDNVIKTLPVNTTHKGANRGAGGIYLTSRGINAGSDPFAPSRNNRFLRNKYLTDYPTMWRMNKTNLTLDQWNNQAVASNEIRENWSNSASLPSGATAFQSSNYGVRVFLSDTPSQPVQGDIDGDNDIDIFDLIKFSDSYGTVEGNAKYNQKADLNNDKKVNIFDLVIFAEKYRSK